ncbi:MAG TPA: tRNA adenosine(34) deaminase TadA [Kofleriaceae bacterium]
MTDDDWMTIALEEARAAAALGDVPVGAVIVGDDDRLLARGRNRRELDVDPTAHAEIVALREAAHVLGHWRVEATLYVTQEPCPMCAGAIVNARVRRVVFGCMNPKAGAVQTLYTIPTDPRLNHRAEVLGGVRADECSAVLTEFFKQLRGK